MTDQTLLILGGSGLLGRYLVAEASATWPTRVHATLRNRSAPQVRGVETHRIDLGDRAQIQALLDRTRPAVVINAAGIVRARSENAYEAALVNSALPHFLARWLGGEGGRLLHVSTDCVFSGRAGSYSEADLPDPVDLYGRSKLAGEVVEEPHLTIRTSFIGSGRAGDTGLLSWFLAQRGRVPGYRHAIWSGLTADELARVLLLLARDRVGGLLHVAGDPVDKATLLELIAAAFGKTDVIVERVDEPSCDRSLRSERLASLGIRVPALKTMLAALAARPAPS